VVTYQLLTGRLPYEGNSLAELAIRRENERPLPPSSYEPDVSEELSAAVLRALENDPADRYPNALELASALRAGLRGVAPSSEAPTRAIGGAATAATRVIPPEEPKTPVSPVPAPAPRREPARPASQQAPAQRKAGRSAFSRFMGAIGGILLIAAVAGIVAAAILLLTDAGSSTDAGEFINDNLDQLIENIKDYVRQNSSG
jgi:serine/threonine-protein kinase